MTYKFFDKNNLHKQIIRKLKRHKFYSYFINNIWGADVADTRLIGKYNKGFRFLLCIDLFSKYGWAAPLKDKKDATIVDVFQSSSDDSKTKPNKIWVDQDSEFYNKSFKK